MDGRCDDVPWWCAMAASPHGLLATMTPPSVRHAGVDGARVVARTGAAPSRGCMGARHTFRCGDGCAGGGTCGVGMCVRTAAAGAQWGVRDVRREGAAGSCGGTLAADAPHCTNAAHIVGHQRPPTSGGVLWAGACGMLACGGRGWVGCRTDDTSDCGSERECVTDCVTVAPTVAAEVEWEVDEVRGLRLRDGRRCMGLPSTVAGKAHAGSTRGGGGDVGGRGGAGGGSTRCSGSGGVGVLEAGLAGRWWGSASGGRQGAAARNTWGRMDAGAVVAGTTALPPLPPACLGALHPPSATATECDGGAQGIGACAEGPRGLRAHGGGGGGDYWGATSRPRAVDADGEWPRHAAVRGPSAQHTQGTSALIAVPVGETPPSVRLPLRLLRRCVVREMDAGVGCRPPLPPDVPSAFSRRHSHFRADSEGACDPSPPSAGVWWQSAAGWLGEGGSPLATAGGSAMDEVGDCAVAAVRLPRGAQMGPLSPDNTVLLRSNGGQGRPLRPTATPAADERLNASTHAVGPSSGVRSLRTLAATQPFAVGGLPSPPARGLQWMESMREGGETRLSESPGLVSG